METIEKKSTDFYNVLRVIATILVVIGHAGYVTWTGDSGEISLSTDDASDFFAFLRFSLLGKAGEWIYGFHMPLFFMLSGALYTYSQKVNSFNELVKNKVKRLIIPYYLVGIIYMFPIKRLSGFYTSENYVEALEGFLLGNNSAHLWFLLVLFWCFVLFYPLEKYVMRQYAWVGVILVLCTYFWGGAGIDLTIFSCIPRLSTAFSYLPYFIGGYLIEKFRQEYDLTFLCKIIITIILVILTYLQYCRHLFSDDLVVILLGSATIYIFSYWICKIPHFMNFAFHKILLRNSMYIYLFHDPINFLILKWAIDYNVIITKIGAVSFFAARTVGTILISIVIGEFIELVKRKINFTMIRRHSCINE